MLKHSLSIQQHNDILEANKLLNNTRNNTADSVDEDFNNFVQNSLAEVHEVKAQHGIDVVESYFNGNPPFKTVKNRKDFPDAFIWQTIKDLSTVYNPLHVIVRDGGLFSACKSDNSLTTYESLEEFIESDAIKDSLAGKLSEKQYEVFGSQLPFFTKYIKGKIDTLFLEYFVGETFEDPTIPDDNHEATIESVGESDRVDLSFQDMKYYGAGVFIVPFSASFFANIYYYIFKMDYYALHDDQIDRISISDHNDHYFEASEEANLEVEGFLSIIVKTVFTDENSFEENATIQIDRVESILISDPTEH